MKWMIASDLHGSAICCERLFARMREENAERLLLLGDLLYHGPRNALPEEYDTAKVASMLNAHKDVLFCVRGNCDTEVDQMVLEFPIGAEYSMLCIDGITLFATHGHVFNRYSLPPLPEGSVLIHGHTHIPEKTKTNGIYVFNPGSVTIPKGGSSKGYMTLENGLFQWKKLDGAVIDEIRIEAK